MYVTVILLHSRVRVVIPVKYIFSLDIVQVYNRGISRNKDHIVYYSSDDSDEPNFRLPIKKEFDPFEPACYEARILNTFGKFHVDFRYCFEVMCRIIGYFISQEHVMQHWHSELDAEFCLQYTMPTLNLFIGIRQTSKLIVMVLFK